MKIYRDVWQLIGDVGFVLQCMGIGLLALVLAALAWRLFS